MILNKVPQVVRILLGVSVPIVVLCLFCLVNILNTKSVGLFSIVNKFAGLGALASYILTTFITKTMVTILGVLCVHGLEVDLFGTRIFLERLFSKGFSSCQGN